MKEDVYLSVFLVMIIICSIFIIKNSEVDKMNDDKVIVAGTFRIIESVPVLLNDTTHKPLNVLVVGYDLNTVYIHYPEVEVIHTFIIAPDESFAPNVTCGASVNTHCASIKFYVNGLRASLQTLSQYSEWGNFWFYGVFSK